MTLNVCDLNLRPPANIESPSTSKELPMIDPVKDALTIPVSPERRAVIAITISARFPKVALSRPPIPSLVLSAKCSVALPIQPASGMMEIPARTNCKAWDSGQT